MTLTEAELVKWGERIGSSIEPPAFIALRGDLGAGKSVLARAIAHGAGVRAAMPSPTFNLVFRYPAASGRSVVHLDLYRLEDPAEVWALGWRELPDGGDVVLVEWPERVEHLLPEPRWEVTLEHAGADLRRVTHRTVGTLPPLPEPRS